MGIIEFNDSLIDPILLKSMWINSYLRDAQRIQPSNLKFKLNQGENKITFKIKFVEILFRQLYFQSFNNEITYETYLNNHNNNVVKNETLIAVEAENPVYRNDLSIRYGTDKVPSVTSIWINGE